MIVERHIDGIDIAMPVIGAQHPWLLPPSSIDRHQPRGTHRDDSLPQPAAAGGDPRGRFGGSLNVAGSSSSTPLVLAAQRPGGDSLAQISAGGRDCLVDIQCRPMIAWVLDALLRAPMVGKVLISIQDDAVPEGIPELAAWVARGWVEIVASRANLYASVKRAHSGHTSTLSRCRSRRRPTMWTTNVRSASHRRS